MDSVRAEDFDLPSPETLSTALAAVCWIETHDSLASAARTSCPCMRDIRRHYAFLEATASLVTYEMKTFLCDYGNVLGRPRLLTLAIYGNTGSFFYLDPRLTNSRNANDTIAPDHNILGARQDMTRMADASTPVLFGSMPHRLCSLSGTSCATWT